MPLVTNGGTARRGEGAGKTERISLHMEFSCQAVNPKVRGGAGCDEPLRSSRSAAISLASVRAVSGLESNQEADPRLRPVLPARVDPRSRERPRRYECLATRARFDRVQGPARSRRRGADDHRDTGATTPRRRFDRDGSGIRCVPSVLHGDWSARRSTGHRAWSAERNERRNGSSGLSANDTSFSIAIRCTKHYTNHLARVKREMYILDSFCIYFELFFN